MNNFELIDLPWISLVTFAGGYMGYFMSHLGVRGHHKQIDVAFSTLTFGLLVAGTYTLLAKYSESLATVAGIASAVIAGAFWNRFGRSLTYRIIRRARISHSDETPSAWFALFQKPNLNTLQLSVKLIDGTWLHCADLRKFENAPDGPCTLGAVGDLLMYVTHQQGPDEEGFEPVERTFDEEWGYEVTFIPREQIARMDLRRKVATRITSSSEEVGE